MASVRLHRLRHRYVGGLSNERLAALYDMHKQSVSRLFGRLHRVLLDRISERLRSDLGLADTDMPGILGLVQSRIDFSLRTILRSIPPTDRGQPDASGSNRGYNKVLPRVFVFGRQ